MDKILSIFAKSPTCLAGFNSSKEKTYRVFQNDFYNKRLVFGSMSDDKKRYSKDLRKVLSDYKSASKNWLQSK